MATLKAHGFVLKARNFGEADKIYTFLTKDKGKFTALAKGVRRIKSKRAGSLDVLNEVTFSFSDGYSLPVITEVVLINSFSEIKKELEKIKFSYLVIELIDKFMHEGDKTEEVFMLVKGALSHLAKLPINEMPGVVCYFELKLVSSLGYLPEFERCVGCGKELSKDWGSYRFSFDSGGLLCDQHVGGVKLTFEQVDLLRFIRDFRFKDVSSNFELQQDAVALEGVIRGYAESLLETSLKSTRVGL